MEFTTTAFLVRSFIFQYPWVAHELHLKCPFFIGFRNVFFPRAFNRKKRLRDEREERLHCKEKKIGGGPKLYGKPVISWYGQMVKKK